MTPVEIIRGEEPVVLGIPHAGTWLPDDITERLNDTGRGLADTDWHIDRLYQDLLPGATIVRARFHRYVIDANRDPSGTSLYPGKNTTGLVPMTDFDGRSIWKVLPDAREIEMRRQQFHAPYHAALAGEMERLRARHGIAILYDCHSIRSKIPFLFDGILPAFNIGTNNGFSCAQEIEAAVDALCATTSLGHVVNGRFKGGWTTRHYGRPEDGWHAIQMELAQRTYLVQEAPPWTLDDSKALGLRPVLASILQRLKDLAPTLRNKA